ncbi:MAG: LD-carboxypeptidase [Desulfomonile sp.]|nr:LD-carboxypeptidase [Desulfomonile sp.]
MCSAPSDRVQANVKVPQPLKPGDTVGIVAPSGPVEEALLMKGAHFLESLGFSPQLGRFVCENTGYLAGNDATRCVDLNTMLADPSVRGIAFARGGYGVMRLLESIDYLSIERDPKLLLGMSDLTALQLALFARHGLVTLSGPIVAGQLAEGLDPLSERSLVDALGRPFEGLDLFSPCVDMIRIERHGRVRGVLLGGCLSLVTALLGTPYSPDYRGALLLLEDVGEPLYRIDRMLVHLKLAGIIAGVGGVVLGHFIGPAGEDLSEEAARLVSELTAGAPIPVVSHFPHGHRLPNLTLPHGAKVELDTKPPALIVRDER